MHTSYSISSEQRAAIAESRAGAINRVREAYAQFAQDAARKWPGFPDLRQEPIARRATLERLRRNSPRRNTESLMSSGFSLRSDGLTPFPENVAIITAPTCINLVFADDSKIVNGKSLFQILGLKTEDPSDKRSLVEDSPDGHVLVRMPPGYYLDPEGFYIGDILIGTMRPDVKGLAFVLDENGLWHIELARENLPKWLEDPTCLEGPPDGCDV